LFAEPRYTYDFFKSEVRPFGYKTTFPGGISILHYKEGSEIWTILGMQNLYKLKSIDETLAMRYNHSRRTLLEYFFEEASDKNANYIEYKIYLREVQTPMAKQDKIISVGKRYGYYFLELKKPDESQIEVLVLEKG
jgi:hypothetical protein